MRSQTPTVGDIQAHLTRRGFPAWVPSEICHPQLDKSHLLFDGLSSTIPRLVQVRNRGTRESQRQPPNELVLNCAGGIGHFPDLRKNLSAANSVGFRIFYQSSNPVAELVQARIAVRPTIA